MDSYEIAHALQQFAISKGFTAERGYFCNEEIRCVDPSTDKKFYSDAAHDWCEACTKKIEAICQRAGFAFDPGNWYGRDPGSPDDSTAQCDMCGVTLDHTLSSYGVSEELAHYDEHRIDPSDTINPQQAWELACLLASAGDEALPIGQAALAAIANSQTP